MRQGLWLAILGVLLAAAWAVALVTGRPAAAVDWGRLRIVAFESDDWGLQGFVPDADAWDGIDRSKVAPGRFPEVYWGSTLEDSADVAALCAVFEKRRGRDGVRAVFQPNYVMSAWEWGPTAGGDGRWERYDLPELGPRYLRPGLWAAVDRGIAAGVWRPEFHASWHYDPERRFAAALSGPDAQAAAGRGVLLFPGSEAARELGPWRPMTDLAAELDRSLDVFQRRFGRPPTAVIAPDYTWQAKHEDLWSSRGLSVIQGKREQRNPDWGTGPRSRWAKLWGRSLDRVRHPDRIYLERNCRFEPVQTADPAATAAECVRRTRRAWAVGEPAIIETHRINFAHTDPAVARTGRTALEDFFETLEAGSGPRPWYAADAEIAMLQRGGASWSVTEGALLLRNGAHGARLIRVPGPTMRRLGLSAGHEDAVFLVGAGESRRYAAVARETKPAIR